MPNWGGVAKDYLKNLRASEWVISARKYMGTKAGGRLARYSSIGAGMGAVRGMADNLIGQDRTSVLGGAIQGGMYGAAFFGLAGAWKYGRGMRKTQLAARNIPGMVNRGTVPGNIITPNIGAQTRSRTFNAPMRRGRL